MQAEKFGAELAVARTALRLRCGQAPLAVELGEGAAVRTRAIDRRDGRRVPEAQLPELRRFEGLGVYYGATAMEGRICHGEDVIVVGGGNSAGQAAMFLASCARTCTCSSAGPALKETMLRYLIRRIEETANLTLHTHTEIVASTAGPLDV